MGWPLSQEYNEAVQNPALSFSDPELKGGNAVINAMGLPVPRSGNFADVYQISGASGARWAVKCFTREVPGLHLRYSALSKHLLKAKLPFAVDFTYQQEGIRVDDRWHPLLKMPWVEGFLLNEFVRGNLDKLALLEGLGQIWLKMARRLRETRIAHADLQHGNVILVPGIKAASLAVKLIDYDGMWVPSLAQTPSGEVGHANFQHPRRLQLGSYNAEVDRFPLLAVACALRALWVAGKSLWDKYDNGDNLLFREADFKNPGESRLLKELWNLHDATTHDLVGHLTLGLACPLEKVSLLAETCMGIGVSPLTGEQEAQVTRVLGEGAHVNRPIAAPRAAAVLPAAVVQQPVDHFAGLDQDNAPSPPVRQRSQSGSHKRLVLTAACLGVVAVISVAAFMLTRSRQSSPPDPGVSKQPKSPISGSAGIRPEAHVSGSKEKMPRPKTAPADNGTEGENAMANEEGEDPAFNLLFNGKNLSNWNTKAAGDSIWEVKGGTLIGRGGTGYLFTDADRYENFHLHLKVSINDAGNSGVFLRTAPNEAAPGAPPNRGYEAEISMSTAQPGRTGSLYCLPSGSGVSVKESPLKPGDWFDIDILAEGPHVVVKINGETTADYVDAAPTARLGRIGLQVYGSQTVVKFRKIALRELPPGDLPLRWAHTRGVFEQVRGKIWRERIDNTRYWFRELSRLPDRICLYREEEGDQIKQVRVNLHRDAAYVQFDNSPWYRFYVGGWKAGERIAPRSKPAALALQRGRIEVVGELAAFDPTDKFLKKSPHQMHPLKMGAGSIYVIGLSSGDFDSFLRLENPQGRQVASNDDARPGTLDSRIVYKAAEEGTYKIVVTSLDTNPGAYLLTVRPGTEEELARAKPFRSIVGKSAPEIVGDFALDGETKMLSDLNGKVVLLDFWAVWCQPCIATFPHLREWRKAHQKDGLEILGVTTYFQSFGFDKKTGSVKQVAKFNKEQKKLEGGLSPSQEQEMIQNFAGHHQLSHRLMMLSQQSWQKAHRDYLIRAIPHQVLIDRNGQVRMVRVGSGDADAADLHEEIKKLLRAGPEAKDYKATQTKADEPRKTKVAQPPTASKALPKRLDLSLGSGVKLTLTRIDPGKFLMGSPADEVGRNATNEFQHEVEITNPFHMGIYEVTRGQFKAFVKATKHKTDAETNGQGARGYNLATKKLEGPDPRYTWRFLGFPQTDEHPVLNVSWNDAVAFCDWLTKKTGHTATLPTEAEWEYCCRAGTKTRFYRGYNVAGYGNVGDAPFVAYMAYKFPANSKLEFFGFNDGYLFASPAGKYKKNAWGLYDMHGNAWEWCHDWYDQDYYRTSPVQDPRGPVSGKWRVRRGGGYESIAASACRCALRVFAAPEACLWATGFRVVVRPPATPSAPRQE